MAEKCIRSRGERQVPPQVQPTAAKAAVRSVAAPGTSTQRPLPTPVLAHAVRALDAVAPQLEAIVGSVGARAISRFGLEVARLHWDMTSISLYGAYEDPDTDHPAPRFGHPKDRRPDLKQIQTGIAVSGDEPDAR